MNDSVRQLIQEYVPSQEVVDLVGDTTIILLCGITGAGKDTVGQQLLQREQFSRIITSTTRAPRENDGVMEVDGREYYFFSTEAAIERIQRQGYFEVAVVHERINGVTVEEVRRLHDNGLIAVGNVDYQGVDYFKRYSPSTLAIFLLPPSFESWMQRLQRRYDTPADFEAAWPARRESALRELCWALASDDLHYVINDELSAAVDAVDGIIHQRHTDVDGRAVAQALLDELERQSGT